MCLLVLWFSGFQSDCHVLNRWRRALTTLVESRTGSWMPNILIVDDDALMRDALHKTLVRAGYEVEDASRGTAALLAYQRQPRDLVITDIIMANGEGLDTIRALRKLDAHVKIIAISGGGVGRSDGYLNLASIWRPSSALLESWPSRFRDRKCWPWLLRFWRDRLTKTPDRRRPKAPSLWYELRGSG